MNIIDVNITHNLLFADNSFDSYKNSLILDATIDYLIKTRQCHESLFKDNWELLNEEFSFAK